MIPKSSKRVGLLGAQMINSGIGVQSVEFAKHLNPEKILIADLADIHEASGKKVTSYPSRFNGFNTRTSNGYPSYDDILWLLDGIDVLFFIETALSWDILAMAKERGIKTIGQMNYELIDKLHPDHTHYPVPDEIWMPSTWHYEDMVVNAKKWGCKLRYVPAPINRELLPFKPRSKAVTFLHIAGHKTSSDRNGTDIVLAAIPLVKNENVRFVIRTQRKLPPIEDMRVRLVNNETREYQDMYRDGDVLLLPRRYGGLSLQRNEALSVGMPVIMPDISPQTGELSQNWLIPARYQETITTRPNIEIYEVSPQDLADKIDYIASLSGFTFQHWSLSADALAHELDWKVQKPIYEALLNDEEMPDPQFPEEYLDDWGRGPASAS